MSTSLKSRVQHFWEAKPCGSKEIPFPEGTREYFDEVERQRFDGDEFMLDVVGFDRWAGRKVLEVGCGLGSDLIQFARGGAEANAVDLTHKAAALASRRLTMEGFRARVVMGDAERLPFASNSFDLVYSWGVIHHTPDTAAATREIVRVARPGGSVQVMLYNRHSIVSIQAWLLYGLLRGHPFRPVADVLANNVESPGTKAYTTPEAAGLFGGLEQVSVRPIVTRYDLRIGRRLFLPNWVAKFVPSRWGWFLLVWGTKPVDAKT